MPKFLGSEVRRRGKVDDFRSGVTEGAKGFAYGFVDGFAGLVTEPVRGAKNYVSSAGPVIADKQGPIGAIGGTITGSESTPKAMHMRKADN